MGNKPNFNYYYGSEADQFTFFKIPKLLITDDYFKGLSNDAKILYGLLLDRMSLSQKNKWFDEENRAYIVCSIEEIADLLCCSRNKAIKSLQELDTDKGIGLIEKRRLGQGNNTIMYVKNFVIPQDMSSQQSNADSEVQNLNFKKSKLSTSKSPKSKLLEVPIMDPNNTYNNHTDDSENDSNRIISISDNRSDKRYDAESELKAYQSIIKKNIDYDILMQAYPMEQETVEGIYELIVETVLSSGEKILIASNWYPAALVKSKFMKLGFGHIEYVLDQLSKNTTRVRNIKKYILAALFNAPSTIESHYRAEVNADFPQYVVGK